MHAFHQHIACDEHLFIGIMKHGTVVADTISCCVIFDFDVVGEVMDEAKFAEFGYICH